VGVLAFFEFPTTVWAIHQFAVNQIVGFGIGDGEEAAVIPLGMRPLLQAKPAIALEIGTDGSNLFDRLLSLGQFSTPLTALDLLASALRLPAWTASQ